MTLRALESEVKSRPAAGTGGQMMLRNHGDFQQILSWRQTITLQL
jgi:hypothetical protein